jgi:hypothetical protein
MPAFANVAAFLQLVRAANPTYARVKSSSLAPLLTVLNSAAGTAVQVATAITNLRNVVDATYGNKAIKYKVALHYLQRAYPVPLGQWVELGATRSRAVRYVQAAIPPVFNPVGPGMYNNVARLQPVCQWEGVPARSVEDFVYTAPAAVGAVLIHIDAIQGGMHQAIDGMRVVDHMKSVLKAVRHRNGGVCALHIGPTPPVCADLFPDYNAFAAPVAVNELGNRHMGAFHLAFNNFVALYPTIVVMGFDADICVHGNLFGMPEYPAPAPVGTNSLPPLTGQADVVTSRALLVTPGTINGNSYGLINGW